MILFICFVKRHIMTNFNVDEKRGKIILHTGSMNGGKSYALIEIANQMIYSKHNALAFIPKLDSRNKNCISAMDDAMVYPAVVVNEKDPEDILDRIYKEDSKRKVDAVITKTMRHHILKDVV